MTLVRVNPARVMSRRNIAYGNHGWSTQDSGPRVAHLPLDIYSTEDDIIVKASVPGLKPENVEITIEGDTLTIEGEIPGHDEEDVKYLFAERFHGKVSRVLKLNIPVDVDKAEAMFENGVLTLVLPKSEEIKPKVIKVQAK